MDKHREMHVKDIDKPRKPQLLWLTSTLVKALDEVDQLRETLEIVQIGVTGYVTLEEAKCLYDEIESALYPPEDKP